MIKHTSSLFARVLTLAIILIAHFTSGQNDAEYLEPVYDVSSNKTSVDVQTRPTKPQTSFALYPNPATDYVELHWDGFKEGLQSAFTIEIFNAIGKRVLSQKVEGFMKNTLMLPTKDFDNGLYIVEVKSKAGKSLFSQKLSIIK